MNDKIKINIEANINAPIEKVWDYYTQPKHITKWNFASDDWHCPSAENNLCIGGKLNARMEAKDGSDGFDFEAIYDEIILQKKITYRMLDNRNATIFFNASGNSTNVFITFEAENVYPSEMQKAGWQAILNNFKKYVEVTN